MLGYVSKIRMISEENRNTFKFIIQIKMATTTVRISDLTDRFKRKRDIYKYLNEESKYICSDNVHLKW